MERGNCQVAENSRSFPHNHAPDAKSLFRLLIPSQVSSEERKLSPGKACHIAALFDHREGFVSGNSDFCL